MAGVTNKAFRRLCSEYGGGLYVTEMVTARALVERKPESMRIIEHDPDEKIRSIQIYGVDAVNVGKAVRMVVEEDRADHIDLNFGCPAPKVTRRGGGAALPWKTDLFTAIVQTAVQEASRTDIPSRRCASGSPTRRCGGLAILAPLRMRCAWVSRPAWTAW